MSEFAPFGAAVYDRFNYITRDNALVLVTTLSGDELWDAYLAAFPEGSNPVFRERTEHDCSCCRNFVKNLGGVVVLNNDGTYKTVWDVEAEGPYAAVAEKLAALIRSHPIEGAYFTKEGGYGAEVTYEEVEGGPAIRWNHFHGKTPPQCKSDSPGEASGRVSTTQQVFQRGLDELSLSALEVVVDLIESNSLYRGQEHREAVLGFLLRKRQYDALDGLARVNFTWRHIKDSAARFRNTVIGTLVQDISEGLDIEQAVARFESKVAPHNYKRSSAPITKGMIEKALGTLRDLGLESAVRRRYATVSDLSVNDVLFVDRGVRASMKDNLSDLLMTEAASTGAHPSGSKGAIDITGDEFMSRVLPGATGVDLCLDNRHLGNFVSLTAPVDEGDPRLFQWDNGFAWTYDGDVTDSVKQRVKKAGGNVDAFLRISLSWFNYDDLDIHCKTPSGRLIYFGNKAGILDVDMNAGSGQTREPVENLAFEPRHLTHGEYEVYVNQFSRREGTDVGFEIEYECDGKLISLSYDKAVKQNENVPVLSFKVKNGVVTEFVSGDRMTASSRQVEKWGVTTGLTVPVDTVLLSPNHWHEAGGRGNKHHLFVLRGCKNPGQVRGFFNEYLRSDLHQHRKVFEVLGSKTMCSPSDDQLSGVGFSSTRHDRATFIVRKDGSTRTYNVQF